MSKVTKHAAKGVKAAALLETGGDSTSPSRKATRALFVGSFDPITLGHMDLIGRSLLQFDELVIGIGVSHTKQATFSAEERLAQIASLCTGWGARVQILTFSGLTVDLAREVRAGVIIRGLRSSTDYDYEMQIAQMNRVMLPEVETILLPTKAELAHISSSLAKDIGLRGGPAELLVPQVIAKALKERAKK